MVLAEGLRWVLGAVLLYAALAKLAAPRDFRRTLLSATEAGLAIAVIAGSRLAAAGAAALLGLFGVVLLAAVARGRAGEPCGCFGRRSRIGRFAVARAFLLAAGFAALPFMPTVRPSTDAWLGAGLVVALAGVATMGVALLALARELGEVRLTLGPQAALSLESEGPELGTRVGLIDRFELRARLAVAVFSSPGCRLCRALEPALRLVASDPDVDLQVFDEVADEREWRALGIPGSPYSVVLDGDGTVLAKGTFNTLPQLEGLLAAAERRVYA